MEEKTERILQRIEELVILLGGTSKRSTQNYRGRVSKVVHIEYDVQE
tara:strand:+ start:198 stop:338 length:141 start_codon:yes stop_codon:yes gene_type:complete